MAIVITVYKLRALVSLILWLKLDAVELSRIILELKVWNAGCGRVNLDYKMSHSECVCWIEVGSYLQDSISM